MKTPISIEKGPGLNLGKNSEHTASASTNITRMDAELHGKKTGTGHTSAESLTQPGSDRLQESTQTSEDITQARANIAAMDARLSGHETAENTSGTWDYTNTQSVQQRLDGCKGSLKISELRGGGNLFLLSAQNEHAAYTTQHEQNHYQGKIGENQAVRERVYQTLFPQTDAYLGTNTELPGGKEGVLSPDSREKAFKRAEQYFQDHPDARVVITARKFDGGAPYSLDGVDMLITRKNIEDYQRGQDVIPLYLVSEAKTGESELSARQRMFSYVETQAGYMARNEKYDDRREVGADLLQAVAQEKAMYVIYRLDTKTGMITYEVQSGLKQHNESHKEFTHD